MKKILVDFGFKPGINTVIIGNDQVRGKLGNNQSLLKKRDRHLRI